MTCLWRRAKQRLLLLSCVSGNPCSCLGCNHYGRAGVTATSFAWNGAGIAMLSAGAGAYIASCTGGRRAGVPVESRRLEWVGRAVSLEYSG